MAKISLAKHFKESNTKKLIFLLVLGFIQISSAQSAEEIHALKKLYNSTGGDGWDQRLDFDLPLCGQQGTRLRVMCDMVQDGGAFELHVIELYLVGNSLVGTIPSDIGNLSYLRRLSLNHNKLTGTIPPEISKMQFLTYLTLLINVLSGEIPSEIVNLTLLEEIDLSYNELSGEIPSEIVELTHLQVIGLSYNELSGEIPFEIVELISIRGNSLTGTTPVLVLPDLDKLYLSSNQFSCPLFDFSYLPGNDFRYLRLEMNCEYYGTWEVASCLACEHDGTRPVTESFCSDDGIRTIDELNCESSPKPTTITCVGVWITSDWGRCVDSLQERSTECRSSEDNILMDPIVCLEMPPILEQSCFTSWFTRDIVIIIGVLSGFIILVVAFACYRQKKYKKLQQKKNIIQFKDLSEIIKLSEGHFGIIYKAIWNSPKGVVSVVCKTPKLDPSKNEWLESMVLNKVKPHENVLSLCGICLDFRDEKSEIEGICIVVPFYHQGSLDNYLPRIDNPLSLEETCLFALGMVNGLDHLHNSGFLHRDIAARNYLLNSDCTGTILSDFGLSRPISEDENYKFIGSAELPAINAPETLSKALSTKKSDIWQLGVAFWWLHAAGRTQDFTPFSGIDDNTFLSTIQRQRNSSVPLKFFDSFEFVEIIKKCCSFYPKDRPTTEQIIGELTSLLQDPEYKNRDAPVAANTDANICANTDANIGPNICANIGDNIGTNNGANKGIPNIIPQPWTASDGGYEVTAPGSASAMALNAYHHSAPGVSISPRSRSVPAGNSNESEALLHEFVQGAEN